MPFEIERDGKTIKVWTEEEMSSEVAGLRITNENLKNEKRDITDKLTEAKESVRAAEEAKAKAEGDKDTLQRIADERAAEKDKKINDLIASTKREKVANAVNDLITKLGAGGAKNEDLRDLVKSRFDFDYDIDNGVVKVSGDGVSSIADLEKAIKDSGRYGAYLAGSGATGGGAAGNTVTGGAVKKFNEYTGAELASLRKENPSAYEQIKNNFYSK